MPMALKGGGVWNRGRWWWQWAWLVGVDALPKCCFNTFSNSGSRRWKNRFQLAKPSQANFK